MSESAPRLHGQTGARSSWLSLGWRRGAALAVIVVLPLFGGLLRADRRRPPDFVTCDRNHLTSFTGRVTDLTRGPDRTSLTIATDWDTIEHFVLRRPEDAVSRSFFVDGRPFAERDWGLILDEGRLRSGLRATVWVCSDEKDPKVDWETGPEGRPR